jgi:hypothetical protein
MKNLTWKSLSEVNHMIIFKYLYVKRYKIFCKRMRGSAQLFISNVNQVILILVVCLFFRLILKSTLEKDLNPGCLIKLENNENNLKDGFKTLIISMTQKDSNLVKSLQKQSCFASNIFTFKLFNVINFEF